MKLYDTTGWSASTFDAMNYSVSQINQREGSRKGTFGVLTSAPAERGVSMNGATSQASRYSIVGLDTTKVGPVCDDIFEYVNDIEVYLDKGINLNADMNQAFKSAEVQTAVNNYIDTVKKYCINLTSQLLAFSDKLKDARNKYQVNMEQLANKVTQNATAFDTGTKYSADGNIQ